MWTAGPFSRHADHFLRYISTQNLIPIGHWNIQSSRYVCDPKILIFSPLYWQDEAFNEYFIWHRVNGQPRNDIKVTLSGRWALHLPYCHLHVSQLSSESSSAINLSYQNMSKTSETSPWTNSNRITQLSNRRSLLHESPSAMIIFTNDCLNCYYKTVLGHSNQYNGGTCFSPERLLANNHYVLRVSSSLDTVRKK